MISSQPDATIATPAAPPLRTPRRALWRYVFTTDHKIVALQYLFGTLAFLFFGACLAMLMRWQLGWPMQRVPGLGRVLPALSSQGGIITPELYASIFSLHGTIMVYFVVIPLAVNALGGYLVPLMVGARNMTFPLLNALSFWAYAAGGAILLGSMFTEGGAAAAGWTAYAPLAALGTSGQDWWIIALLLAGASGIMSTLCYVTTIVNGRAAGMTLGRLPMTAWAMLATSGLTLLAVPALTVALLLLLFDRNFGTSFFMPSNMIVSGERLANPGGGQPLLWQHLFWFYAHPAVYIMIMPGMGMVSDMLPAFARKPLFGYKSTALATCSIAFLGFLVWGHHMFQSGMNPYLGTTFMISTMAIAAPSALEVFNWLATLWRGSLRLVTPMLFILGFLSLFVIGGLSGVFMASTPVDIYVHDTYFVVAHLHYIVFGGSMFAMFAAIYFWFPKMFGVRLGETLGRWHFGLTYVLFNLTFFPMHLLGVGGMQRRIYDPTIFPHLAAMQPVNVWISVSAYALFVAQLVFAYNFVRGLWRAHQRTGPRAGDNPWEANTLEWQTTSPPPEGNFAERPIVVRGPHEYGSPECDARGVEHLPQNVA